jgi:hypothetical protein
MWKCCPVCTGPHDTWDCEKAQEIVRTHVGMVAPTLPPNTAVELVMEETYKNEPRRAVSHRNIWDSYGYTVIR